jgi:hypothetical protein
MTRDCPRCGSKLDGSGRCTKCSYATGEAVTHDDAEDPPPKDDAKPRGAALPKRDAIFRRDASPDGAAATALAGLERRFVERVDGKTPLHEVASSIGVNLRRAQLIARDMLKRKVIEERRDQ